MWLSCGLPSSRLSSRLTLHGWARKCIALTIDLPSRRNKGICRASEGGPAARPVHRVAEGSVRAGAWTDVALTRRPTAHARALDPHITDTSLRWPGPTCSTLGRPSVRLRAPLFTSWAPYISSFSVTPFFSRRLPPPSRHGRQPCRVDRRRIAAAAGDSLGGAYDLRAYWCHGAFDLRRLPRTRILRQSAYHQSTLNSVAVKVGVHHTVRILPCLQQSAHCPFAQGSELLRSAGIVQLTKPIAEEAALEDVLARYVGHVVRGKQEKNFS